MPTLTNPLSGLGDAIWKWWDPLVAQRVSDVRFLRYLTGEQGHTLWICVLLTIVWLIYRVFFRPGSRRSGQQADRPLRHRRQPWHRRLKLWWIHRFDQPYYWKIGKHVANLNQTHGLVVGGSGSGKSTLVVSLILQPTTNLQMWLFRRLAIWEKRPVEIISFDRSDPIEEATNVLEDKGVQVERWRVRQANGWNMIKGDREMIAEALPTGWPSGDNTGFFQQLATDAISAALQEQDEEASALGLPEWSTRDFDDMIIRMDRIMDEDPETPDLARKTWVRRFKSLARVMGESIGEDFDLVSALQPGAVVHLSSNSYTNPALTPLVGAMAITHTKLAAEQVKGGAYLILEEASFLKKRSDLLDDLAKSMRARGWRVLYLNQDPCSVGDALQVNFGIAVFMGLGPLAVKAREWCANVVKDFPGAFRAAELVLGATIDQLEGYVLLNGKCRDVSLAPYITSAAEHRPAKRKRHTIVNEVANRNGSVPQKYVPTPWTGSAQKTGCSNGTSSRDGINGTVIEVEGFVNGVRALPAAVKPTPPEYFVKNPLLLKEWDGLSGTYDPMGCWLIDEKKTNTEKRAKIWVPKGTKGWGETVEEKGGYVTGYVIACNARRGPMPKPELDENGKVKQWQVDHWCHTEDLHCGGGRKCLHLRCLNGDHMEWVSPRINTWRMRIHAERRKMLLSGEKTSWSVTVAQEAEVAAKLATSTG